MSLIFEFNSISKTLKKGEKMFLSHPKKELMVHLKEVYLNMLRQNNLINDIIPKDKLDILVKVVAYGHDFGKYNPKFQKYIKCISEGLLYDGDTVEKEHQLISAIFTLFIADNMLNDCKLSLIAASCVFSHHGKVKEFSSVTTEYSNKNYIDKISHFIDLIRVVKLEVVEEYVAVGFDKDLIGSFFEFNISELMKKYQVFIKRVLGKSKSTDLYIIHQLVYSALIESDKLSASDTVLPLCNHISYDEYVAAKNNILKPDNGWRTNINKDVIDNLMKNKHKNIFTITAPTGSGKTVTGAEAAILLRELCSLDRIYYVLPFTSIINQSYSFLKKIFGDVDSTYIMKYHSLSNEKYFIDSTSKKLVGNSDKDFYCFSEQEYNFNQIDLIMSGLHSGFTITTFNQLIESIISNKNAMLRKLNNFNNSVILIDEIQTLPLCYLNVIEKMLQDIVQHLNIKIIVMTATKPFVFKETAFELLESYEDYFKIQNRTKLSFVDKLKPIDVTRLVIDILRLESKNKTSMMIICNTIKSSLNIYNELVNAGVFSNDDRYYLSTNIIPKERQRIIREVKEKLKCNKKVMLVCTQLVEAGVDLDFEVVYRDIAPLPSIIQSAGRCNREGLQNDVGDVKIFALKKDGSDFDLCSHLVYDANSDIEPTVKCLSEYSNDFSGVVFEKDYLCLIKSFYNKMAYYYDSHQKSVDILENIYNLKTDSDGALSKFSLISEKGYLDVFIPIDELGIEILKKYREGFSIKDISRRREHFFEIKADIQNYIISLPPKVVISKLSFMDNLNGLIVVKEECVEYVYDFVTGFIRNGDGGDGLFI